MKRAKPYSRSLRPGELGRRYRRLRYGMPPVDGSDDQEAIAVEESWETYDPRDWECEDNDRLGATLIAVQNGLVAQGSTIAAGVINVDWDRIGLVAREAVVPNYTHCVLLPDTLTSALYQFVFCPSEFGTPLLGSVDDLSPRLGCELTKTSLAPFRWIARRLDRYTEEFSGYMGGLFVALKLSPFWVRSPIGFNRMNDDVTQTIGDLMEHLFTVYRVPRCLRNTWTSPFDSWSLRWVFWFILAGQGTSISRAGELFGWRVSTRVIHRLSLAPDYLSPKGAYTWAEVKNLGGSDIEVRRLLANPAYWVSPASTDDPSDLSFLRFWADSVRWLIKHRSAVTDEICELILPWALHRYRQQEQGGAVFSWKGRSLAGVLRTAQEYELSLQLPNCQLRWGPKGWDQEWQTEEGAVWTMTELLSGKQLFHEGEAMSNCVASYAQRCAFGDSAIFSLRCGGMRRLTVEVNPSTRSIVQAKGPRNRMPSAEEAARLLDWQDGRFANSG